ncbi:nucleotide sugar dehydrogenase [Nocardiopsis sp. ATB16-24]|uniref:nucleotide sugar dehydrogenase n=1 Tax=Nocardiopsis sp. ATB16-24 TaxID=3019555 RepID=UPI002556B959|nr:nucleotide sugar dehydrogenase [Nocardiopsis sp. ATB16-24]
MGGCGRVGLPLAIALAESGLEVAVHDIDRSALEKVKKGVMPFDEEGAQLVLSEVLSRGRLHATADPSVIGQAETVVIAVGTPVDEELRPDSTALDSAVEACRANLRHGQLFILRSTVFPGVTASFEKALKSSGKNVDTAYCPERIAEGHAMRELRELPQLVGGRSEAVRDRAARLFERLGAEPVHLVTEEAEFAKLATNAWRYMTFAITNELFMIASDHGLDYARIRDGLQYGYPRAAGLPAAGFSAGPCLPKDTAQLAAFAGRSFTLGAAALEINEGLPRYLVRRLAERYDLGSTVVGLLGMSFKKDSDDIRDSLAYVVRDELEKRGARVLCTDPNVTGDPSLRPLAEVLDESDVLVVTAPHTEYRGLATRAPALDICGVLGDARGAVEGGDSLLYPVGSKGLSAKGADRSPAPAG